MTPEAIVRRELEIIAEERKMPMTFAKPEDKTIMEWATEGLNLKTVVLMVAFVVGLYYALGTRVTVLEVDKPTYSQRFDETTKAIENQNQEIQKKVDKDTYESDQRRLAEELTAIQESEGRIESALIDQHRK